MARIRSVHPSLFTDEAWVSCSPLARILYIALWTDADDQGVFEWKPLQIKMRLLPGDMVEAKTLLDELANVDLIAEFQSGGQKYGAIKNFRKFQRPQKPNAVHDLPDNFRPYVAIDEENDPADGLRKELCSEQSGRCFYCATEITHYSKRYNSMEIDHRTPRSRGGSDERSNLVASCRACNRGKCDSTESEWRAKLAERLAKTAVASANPVVASQMEDVGGRREEETSLSSPPAPTPAKARSYPEAFEAAWKAYPHAKGRSSKADSLTAWKKLTDAEREALPGACERYRREGREPRMDCGAPAMERWIKRGLHQHWSEGPARPSVAPADPQVIAHRLRRYRDTGVWEAGWGERPAELKAQIHA